MAMSVILYGAEAWTVTQQDIWKLKSFQMRYLQDVLGIALWSRVRNTEFLESTGMVSVEQQLKQGHLQFFDQVWRMPTNHPQRQLVSPVAEENEQEAHLYVGVASLPGPKGHPQLYRGNYGQACMSGDLRPDRTPTGSTPHRWHHS